MSLLVLSSTDVDGLIKDLPPTQLMDLMRDVFQSISSTRPTTVQSPHRTSIETPSHNVLFMPSRLSSHGTAIKIVSVPKERPDAGLPATTLVIDEASGGVKAMVNARALTALRTAAGSLLATSLLLPRLEDGSTQRKTIVLFGAGQQVSAHARLFLSYYDAEITRCFIVNRSDNPRLHDLVRSLRVDHPTVHIEGIASSTSSNILGSIVCSADIIITATSSTLPLFPSSWIKPSAHLNLIGSYKPTMKEIDPELTQRAKVILVDSKDACAREAGDLMEAGMVREGTDGTPTITDARVFELGEFAIGQLEKVQVVGEAKRDVTIFKSVGVGVQDVAIASLVVRLAEEKRLGTVVPFD